MRHILGIIFVLNTMMAGAQPACDSLFTLQKDKKAGGRHTWIMHTPLRLTNWAKDTATIELRIQKMRDRNDKWVIVVSAVDMMNKCVREGSKVYFRFEDNTEPGYSQLSGNCEGVYQVEMPVVSVGSSMGSNKLKNLLRNKRLISVSLENEKGFTDGMLWDEGGIFLQDIINCMLEE
jgi:hypothetical protein